MKKPRIIFFGTPQYAVPTLERLRNHGDYNVVAVVTQADKAAGRGKKHMPSPVKQCALAHDLVCFSPEKLNTDEMYEALKALNADAFVTIAYGKILRPRFLALPRVAPLNLHASLLPKWRGAAPIAWSLVEGDDETGVCLMRMDEGMDTGPVYSRRIIPIADADNAASLHDKLAELSAEILIEDLPLVLSGALEAAPQEGEPSIAPMMTKSMGAIDFSQSAEQIARRIRGFTPWPSAFARFRGKRLVITKAVALNEESNAAHGACVGLDTEHGYLKVACGTGVLGVERLKPEGKAEMDARSFFNGYRVEENELIERWT